MGIGLGELVVILVICAVPTLAIAVGLAIYAASAARKRTMSVPCPHCRTNIDREARVCAACGRDVGPPPAP